MEKRLTRIAKLVFLMSIIVGFALAASAEEWKTGQSLVDSVDSVARTITLDEEVYRVPASCRIHRESGVRVPLSKLRGAGVGLVPMNEVDYVRYEAIEKKSGWEMVEITVLDRAAE